MSNQNDRIDLFSNPINNICISLAYKYRHLVARKGEPLFPPCEDGLTPFVDKT